MFRQAAQAFLWEVAVVEEWRSPAGGAWRVGDVVADRYEVLAVHGQGAMGLVYRVRHRGWGVDLAVKSPRPERFRDESDVALFVREAETWVSLGLHPHVCICHYVRTLDGIPRVFAEYVDGGSLREWIDDRRLYQGGSREVLARVLDIAIQVAWGLAHAHGHSVVHQDVKPANVLLDRAGTAKVSDFGLARARPAAGPGAPAAGGGPSAGPGAGRGGTVLVTVGGMTPAFAAPEQAAGARVSRRSDVWSFAASVLEMFIGEVTWLAGPVAGTALDEYRRSGISGPVPLPPSVADVLASCLRDDPAERPATMHDVAGWLADAYRREVGDPYPRELPRVAELQADELNNRALSLLDLGRTGDAAAAFQQALTADPLHLAATYNYGLQRWRAGTLPDDAFVASLVAVQADAADPEQAAHLLGQVHLERGDPESARPLLEQAVRQAPEDPQAQADLQLASTSDHSISRAVFTLGESDQERVLPTYLNADRRIALSKPDETIVRVWEIATGRRLHDLPHPGAVLTYCTSNDGRWVLSAAADPENYFVPPHLYLWQTDTGRCVRTFPSGHHLMIFSLWLGDGGRVAMSHGADNTVQVWDLTTGRRLLTQEAESLCGNGRLALSGGKDGTVRVWNLQTGDCLRVLDGHTTDVRSVNFSPDGQFALSVSLERTTSGGVDGTARVWDLQTGRCVCILDRDTGQPSINDYPAKACLGPHAQLALVTDMDGNVVVWDVTADRSLRTLEGRDVQSIGLSPDLRLAITQTAGTDAVAHTIRVWDLGTGRRLHTSHGVLIDGHEQVPLTGDEHGLVRQWTVPAGGYTSSFYPCRPRSHTRLSQLEAEVEALVQAAEQAMAQGAFAAAKSRLAQARAVPGWERAPSVREAWHRLLRSATRTTVSSVWRTTTLPRGKRGSFRVSAGGRVVLSDGGGTERVWDLPTGRWLPELPPGDVLRSPRMSADGRVAVSATGREMEVRDVRAARMLRGLNHGEYLSDVCVSADGRLALSAGGGAVRVWDLAAGREVGILDGHADRVTSVHLSTDGRLALTGSRDRTARVWDVETRGCRQVLTGHSGAVDSAVLSTDGRFAFTGGDEGAARIWDVETGRCLQVLERAWSPVVLSADGRFAVTGGGDAALPWEVDAVQVWEIDWDLAVREPADWDGGARPYLTMFLAVHTPFAAEAPAAGELSEEQVRLALTRRGAPVWEEADFASLLTQLRWVGYGWLRPEGVLTALAKMARDRQVPSSPPA